MSPVATTFPQTYQSQFSFHFDETQRLLTLARALPDDTSIVQRMAIGGRSCGTKVLLDTRWIFRQQGLGVDESAHRLVLGRQRRLTKIVAETLFYSNAL